MHPLQPHTSVDVPRDWPGKRLYVSFPEDPEGFVYNDADYIVEYGRPVAKKQKVRKVGRRKLPPEPNGNYKTHFVLHDENRGIRKAAKFLLDHDELEPERLLRLTNTSNQTIFYDVR